MNIIIVGAGEIGRHMAIELAKNGHNISVIESDAERAMELEDAIEGRVIVGNGVSMGTLAEAQIADCELFLALTSENTVNLMSGSIAKALGVQRVVSRVHPVLQREEWMFDFRSHFGIDHIFSSERLTAIDLAKFIRNPDSIEVEEIARGRIELQQIKVSAKSDFAGKVIRDVKIPKNTRFALISRDGKEFVPDADSQILSGDILTVFGDPRKLHGLVEDLQKGNKRSAGPNVVIFGGGEYGLALAQMLESWDCRVRIFEKDPAIASELSERLTETTIIASDATSVSELEEEQVGDADFFVATSDSDEDNVMTCLQANNLGTKSCLTLIHREDYARAISASGRHFGVMAAISPRESARKEISRFVTSEKFHVVKKLGKGTLIETQIKKGAKIHGMTVAEAPWPKNCVLVGMIKGTVAIVPAPDDVLEVGDYLFAMVSENAEKKILKIVR